MDLTRELSGDRGRHAGSSVRHDQMVGRPLLGGISNYRFTLLSLHLPFPKILPCIHSSISRFLILKHQNVTFSFAGTTATSCDTSVDYRTAVHNSDSHPSRAVYFCNCTILTRKKQKKNSVYFLNFYFEDANKLCVLLELNHVSYAKKQKTFTQSNVSLLHFIVQSCYKKVFAGNILCFQFYKHKEPP